MTRCRSSRRPRLDAFDRAILRIVQQDAKAPQRAIAEQVNLSPAAVQRRIAALEDAQVITRNVALVDQAALGAMVTSIVEVHLIDERAKTVAAAKSLFAQVPEIQQCYYVTGGTSFVLVVVSRDIAAYEAMTRELFSESNEVASFRSLIVLDRVKAGMEIVIP